MKKVKRWIVLTLLALVALLALGMGGMYWAVTAGQPSYYLEALEQNPEEMEASSLQLESRLTTLQSDLQSMGEWQTVVAADEINAWLAIKLPQAFPDALPESVRDPRVAITPEAVLLAARTDLAGVETIVSISVEPFVTEAGDLAIEIHHVQAGMMPLPNKEIVDQLSQASEKVGIPIRWTQNGTHKVMVIERSLWDRGDTEQRVLEAIELDDGKLFLSGRTEQIDPMASE